MSDSTRLDSLLQMDRVVAPPTGLLSQVVVPDRDALYREAMADIEAFWAARAKELEWFSPWSKVLDWQYPYAQWFVGATCNITVNCLDRHLTNGRKNKVALFWLGEDGQERVFTYAQLSRLVNRIANGLKALGVGKGDRVCIYMPFTPEGMASMLACARIGAVHSVVYAGLGASALRSRIEDAGATTLITADVGYRRGNTINLKAIVDEAVADLDLVRTVAVHRRQPTTTLAGPREIDFIELIGRQSDVCAPAVMASEDPLFILYTSGTTGVPKGPLYVHGGYAVGTAYLSRIAFDLHEDDVYWCTSDIGWIVGHSSIVYGPLQNGTTLVVREGAPDYPNPGVSWAIVEKYGVTRMFTAPTALRMFMKFGPDFPAQHNRDTLKLLVCAGEPLNPEAYHWTKQHIMPADGYIVDNWWQTETGSPTIGTMPCMPSKPGRAGKPFPGVIADVVDRQGVPVETGKGGFLVLKGPWPHLMRTIWGNNARYEEYWRTIDGWYTAGDVATKDADGYIAVLGRADDVLNVAGHRIGTADVEHALVSHAAVAEAAVIGKPDPIKGEAIKAFVTLKVGQEPSSALEQALVAHVRHELGPIATPGELVFVPRLPKTRSGKIMRRLLKAQELGIDPGDITTLEE